MTGTRAALLAVGALIAALVAGCGSVGEVGSGASRAGVEPVRSTSGFGASPYATMDAKQQSERVKTVAKANQQAEKRTAALLNKTKALPDAAGPEVAEAQAEQPTLDAQTKAVVVGLEARSSSSADLVAAEAGAEYVER